MSNTYNETYTIKTVTLDAQPGTAYRLQLDCESSLVLSSEDLYCIQVSALRHACHGAGKYIKVDLPDTPTLRYKLIALRDIGGDYPVITEIAQTFPAGDARFALEYQEGK